MHLPVPTLLPAAMLLLVLAPEARAQQEQRYYVRPRSIADLNHGILLQTVTTVSTRVVKEINKPKFRFNAVAVEMTTAQQQSLADNNPGLLVIPDAPLARSGHFGGPGSNWAINSLTASGFPNGEDCCGQRPVVYLVDTGIRQTHSEFSATTFLPGMTEGWNYNLSVPTPPDQDLYDHGTRMAGCIAGASTGLLPKLGVSAYLKSIQAYDFPAPLATTFASTAIAALLDAASDHEIRKSTGYVKDHASIVLFAQSTLPSSGRFGDVDRAIEEVWNSGLTVVVSAGNYSVLAADVSPAGAAIGYLPPNAPAPPPTIIVDPGHYWFGPKPPGTNYVRWLPHFIVAGAHDWDFLLWASTDVNNPAVDPVDVFGPGAGIRCATNAADVSFGSGDGTSYGAAYAAATAAFLGYHKPWLTPNEIRTALIAARISSGPNWSRLAIPATLPDIGMTFADWAAHYGLADPDAAASADSDADLLPNLLEYFCGLSPRENNWANAPSITPNAAASRLDIRLPVACYLPTSVSLILQKSSDLITWMPLPMTTFAVENPCHAVGDGRYFSGTAPFTPVSGGREFYRLKVTAP
ncbi:MAG: S8 family serine peptidase [Verrucomicrobiales bacterium]|nr:S8 family serine peptidase [Verrucomicrobiales bacterium]